MKTKSFLVFGLITVVCGLGMRWIDHPRVDSPYPGETLQGRVTISGSTNVPGFMTYEIAFSYSLDNTWFLIHQSNELIRGGPMGVWDTTTISDGRYRLRVRVYLDTGGTSETIVENLVIQNYTFARDITHTPSESEAVASSLPQTPTIEIYPSPSPLPRNPARIANTDRWVAIILGIIFTLSIFGMLGIKLLLRATEHRE